MSPQVARRRATLSLVFMVVAVGALIVSVWIVSDRASSELRRESMDARRQQNEQQRAGCARGVARDFESLATNRDLHDFASEAATARRADGNVRVAKRYEAIAARAAQRMTTVGLRVPASEDTASVARFCAVLYPLPSG